MNAREEPEYLHHRTPLLAPHGFRSISGVFPPPAAREADLRENGRLLACTTQHIPLPPRGHGFWFGFHAQRWASPHAPLSLADACLVSARVSFQHVSRQHMSRFTSNPTFGGEAAGARFSCPVSLVQRSDAASLCVPVGGEAPWTSRGAIEIAAVSQLGQAEDRARPGKFSRFPPHHTLDGARFSIGLLTPIRPRTFTNRLLL
jgi:hypothetical protein